MWLIVQHIRTLFSLPDFITITEPSVYTVTSSLLYLASSQPFFLWREIISYMVYRISCLNSHLTRTTSSKIPLCHCIACLSWKPHSPISREKLNNSLLAPSKVQSPIVHSPVPNTRLILSLHPHRKGWWNFPQFFFARTSSWSYAWVSFSAAIYQPKIINS